MNVTDIVSRVWTADEVAKMYMTGELRSVALDGYVARADADGTCRFVPFDQATNIDRPRTFNVHNAKQELRQGLPERTKRTPQQRVASLMVRLMSDAKRTGTIPGLSDEQVSEIVGEAFKSGLTQWNSEMVRRVAQHYLEASESEAEERDRKRTTRYGGEGN